MLFSIWEEATKNEVENKRTRNKRKYFWSFDYEKEKANKEEIFLGFLNNKQKEQLRRLRKLKRAKRNK